MDTLIKQLKLKTFKDTLIKQLKLKTFKAIKVEDI